MGPYNEGSFACTPLCSYNQFRSHLVYSCLDDVMASIFVHKYMALMAWIPPYCDYWYIVSYPLA